jgi:uncharacterized protein
MNKLNVGWDEYLVLCDRLVEQIKDKRITKIVTLARGGYIISRHIAQKLNIRKIYSIGIEFYDYDNNAKVPIIYQTLTQQFDEDDIIVIIDDIIDTGESIEIAQNEVRRNGGKHIITCSLHYKKHSKCEPNYYAQIIDNDIWVDYYWE